MKNKNTEHDRIKEQIQELAYAIETRGVATFIRELLELYHSHLHLATLVLEGEMQEAKEWASDELKRTANTMFLLVQIAEIMELAGDLSRALKNE